MANKGLKIIMWDIETGFNVATIFSLFQRGGMLPTDSILQERYIICAAWKEFGAKKVESVSVLDNPKRFKKSVVDDYHVVKTLHKVLSEADAIVAHYGDAFDIKYFNTRCVFHGLEPVHDLIQIDTYKIAKGKFLFNSNRLDYLGKMLGVGQKIKTNSELWLKCLNGSKTAIKEMLKYNKQDVNLLEKVYIKLAPYVPAKLNRNILDNNACPLCGSTNLEERGKRYTRTRQYQRYHCLDCGHWSQSCRSDEDIKAEIK